jgi:hypothetical protein
VPAAPRKTTEDPPPIADATTEAPGKPGASSSPEAPEPAAAPEPTSWQYAWAVSTLYLHIPLTAHPEIPAVDATNDIPAVPGRPATVYAFVEPPDSRWIPTDLPPNQLPDNAPAEPEGA